MEGTSHTIVGLEKVIIISRSIYRVVHTTMEADTHRRLQYSSATTSRDSEGREEEPAAVVAGAPESPRGDDARAWG